MDLYFHSSRSRFFLVQLCPVFQNQLRMLLEESIYYVNYEENDSIREKSIFVRFSKISRNQTDFWNLLLLYRLRDFKLKMLRLAQLWEFTARQTDFSQFSGSVKNFSLSNDSVQNTHVFRQSCLKIERFFMKVCLNRETRERIFLYSMHVCGLQESKSKYLLHKSKKSMW